ncbi:MAG: adenylate/guanylate cyclase domain-containing protein [Elusimicrobia bacterium]|nr:adenylate/guanylate cyclase domain-containing protein [Elusimicrobiota bacterium]
MKARPERWIYHQVFSALLAAALASDPFFDALSRLLLGGADAGLAAEALRLPRGAAIVLPLALFAAAFLWFRPIAVYLGTSRPADRGEALKRFEGSYAFLCVLWLAAFAAGGALHCRALHRLAPGAGWEVYAAGIVLPDLFSAYYAVYFTVLYLEPLFFLKVAHRFYEGEALYERKEGLSLGLRAKLFLMLLNLLLIPLALVALSLLQPEPGRARENCLLLIAVTLVYALGYSEMLYRSIAEPISGLIKKMERVRGGDYAVKTSVLSGDEIGVMKAHFNDMVEGLAERERLKDTFGRYVSVEVAKQLLKSGKVRLGGESIEATILFSDIRDFTPMSEKMSPQDLVAFLNSYFSFITEPIGAHHGVVNKFIGDAVMAIFAPQFGSTDHAGDAVKAALAMREKLAEFNAKGVVPHEVRFGVGLHTGVLVAGNIGTEKRLEYTVIGDTVNVASRVESHNKALNSTILISEGVFNRLADKLKGGLKVERCENVKVKGKERALVLYKVL